jgi:hypothetical protein
VAAHGLLLFHWPLHIKWMMTDAWVCVCVCVCVKVEQMQGWE